MSENTQRKIVSANYLDRESDQKWLIRGTEEKPEDSTPFKTVKATNVRFEPSSEIEQGFGCSIIANCETAIGSNENPPFEKKELHELKFQILWFKDTVTDKSVNEVAELYLTEDGKMYALVTENVAETA